MTTDQPVLSLRAVAALAHVQRPVVSMWRSRSADSELPFPEPVAQRGRAELFGGDDIVSWLEASGRGNNPDARADVMLHAQPAELFDNDFGDELEALLCLLRLTAGERVGSTTDQIQDLAEERDPDDDLLFSEVVRAGERAPSIMRYLSRLVDASYGHANALEILDRRQAHLSRDSATLTAEAEDLFGELTAATALDVGASAICLEDVGGHAAAIVAAGIASLREGIEVDVVVSGDDALARSARRRYVISGAGPTMSPPAQRLVIGNLQPSDGSTDVGVVLDAIDNLQLEQTDADRVVIVGPASALCDDLPGEAEKQRAAVLRLGRVRLVAKLPAGLLVHHPRQHLGVWVLGPEGRERPADRRAVMTADLSDVQMSPRAVSELATDVVAALESRQVLHAFAFATYRPLVEVLADGGPVVVPGSRPRPAATSDAEDVLAVQDLLRSARCDDLVALDPSGGSTGGRITVEQALRSRLLTLVPGVRLAAEPLGSGSLRLITSAVVQEQSHPLHVDPLDPGVAGGRRTEPGDVVFVTSPRPRAMVDRDGMSVVAYPARVLRSAPGSGLVPDVLADVVNALPDTARQWRGWLLPQVDPSAADDLGAVLGRLADEESELRRRSAALRHARSVLAGLVADGGAAVTLRNVEKHDKHESQHYAERRVS
ncbi:hypothetical protein SGUI_2872 [Serinicoccus hydrothermalis]|uniref:Uncharacterized protein n=1 Tax=Serinicoccus hydrothermalis TaxID=1758689 RepID=A0A1B1NFR7_9MICO|nr:hypothetical protein [Serinicoccus hydrothermalis]ANS80268.1 hypothetical protein SGUI_2872 [Serinicoccus hydrothermalis]